MTIATLTLAAFLEARIAEDEASAPFVFAEQFTPARVLAEVAAKRAVLAEHDPVDPCDAHDASFETIPCDTLRHLAAIYSDHADYDESWRP